MPSRISLRDIAAEAGCSHVTVSRVLRNQAVVAAETEAKVRAAARKLGYKPDAELAALMARCRQKNIRNYQATLVWLSAWPNGEDQTHYRYWAGAAAHAKKLGYSLERYALADSGVSLSRLRGILNARNVRGIILPPQPRSHTHFDFDWRNFSVVALGFSVAPSLFHVVTNAQSRSMSLAVQNLLRLGYRRIAFLQSAEGVERTDRNFLGGYLAELIRLEPAERIEPFIYDSANLPEARARFDEWLRKQGPDAIIHNDEQVDGWLKRAGLRAPRDIGLVSLNVPDAPSGKAKAAYAGVNQNEEHIGAKAAEYLIGMVQRGEYGVPALPLRILVEGAWVDGRTVRTAEGARSK